MLYLSGAIRDELRSVPDTGYMLTPMMGNRPDLSRMLWAADTGCFGQPEKHTDIGYLNWLAVQSQYQRTCLFATAPDVVGDADATLTRSLPMLPLIRAMGYAAALVAQDGLEDHAIPWDTFDCLFVGGTTDWKLSEAAYQIAIEAKARGKWTHMGRVNSERRLRAAATAGYDSADGTYLVFGPDTNLPKLTRWMTNLAEQPHLWSTT